MDVKALQDKIVAAEQKVEKCKKTIERHKAQMEKKAKQLQDMGIDPEAADKYAIAKQNGDAGREIYWLLCDYDGKKDDIKNAIYKLEAAERICAGWKVKLDLEINRERIVQDQVPQVIKDFLQEWKEKAFEWYVRRHARYLEVKDDLRQQVREAKIEAVRTLPELASQKELLEKLYGDVGKADDHHFYNLWPRKPVEAFLKEKRLDDKSVQERLSWIGDQTIYKMCDFRNEDERLKWLDAVLEQEKKSKLLFFYESVTKITGPITDAKGLYMSAGDLNGVVLGEKGAAKVNTFSAGGWNIQCFHYRMRVDDVTEKVVGKPKLDDIIRTCEGMNKVAEGNQSVAKETEREV